jgi:uncharacterized membrane protein (DUF4010 family)
MFPSGSEYEHILVGLLVMQLGFILSAIPLLFVSKKARLLQRRDLKRWQKHIPSFIALMIASLIAAFGFFLAIFFFTPVEWVKLLKNFIACFSGYLGICLFSYFYTLFYYHSGLEEQVRKLNQTRR